MDKVLNKYGDQLKNNRDLILSVVKNYDKALAYANDELLNDLSFIKEAVMLNGASIAYASETIQNNKNIILEAVKRKGNTLKYASTSLKDNEDVVLAAVKRKGSALKYASLNLQNNRSIVLEAVKNNCAVEYIPSKFLYEDEEIILLILKRSNATSWSLAMANESLRRNKVLVLKAVSKKGLDLEFACHNLQNDLEVLQAAVSQNFAAFNYTSLNLSEIKKIVFAAVKKWSWNFFNKTNNYYKINESKYNVLLATYNSVNNLREVDCIYKNDKELILLAIELNAKSYDYASDLLKKDRDVVITAIKQDKSHQIVDKYISLFCSNFKNDHEILELLWDKTGVEVNDLKDYENYFNTTLLEISLYKLEANTLSSLSKCKTLFYPGAGYDFSTIQFFIENSNINNFYYADYMNLEIHNETIFNNLTNWFGKWDYKIIEQIEIPPSFFKEKNWDKFWYPSSAARYNSELELSFITKYIIEKEGKTWNLYYFGTEGIATYEVLLRNKISLDVVVTQDHGQGGCWTSFCNDSLLETTASKYKMLPKIILSGGVAWKGYQEASDWFGKFGLHERKRKIWKRSKI